VGFDSVRLANVAFGAVLALAVGFFGALYLGARLFTPAEEATSRELRSGLPMKEQAKSGEPPILREPEGEQTGRDPQPAGQAATSNALSTTAPADRAPVMQARPGAARQVTEPANNPDDLVRNSQGELRLGRQERRRLRAERRRALEDAKAGLRERPRAIPREGARDGPFFPFRLQ
jgi:hypothetical protein